MIRSRLIAPLLATVTLLFALAAESATPPPAEAFGTVPAMLYPRLTPNGNLLAYGEQDGDAGRVVLFDLLARKRIGSYGVTKPQKLRDLVWADDSALLARVSVTHRFFFGQAGRSEVSRVIAIDLPSNQMNLLLSKGTGGNLLSGGHIQIAHPSKPGTVIMSAIDLNVAGAAQSLGSRIAEHDHSAWVWTLFEVNAHTGASRIIERGGPFTNQWVADRDANAVARGDYDSLNHNHRVFAKDADGRWREIATRTDGTEWDLIALTADRKAVLAIGDDAGRHKLMALPVDGSAPKVVVEDPTRDVTGVGIDPLTGAPIAAIIGGSEHETRYFDADAEHTAGTLARAFPGKHVRLIDHTTDGKKMLAEVYGPGDPAVYYLVDLGAHRADIAGEAYPALAGVTLGRKEAVSYPARDGTPIPAYLTLPAGKDPKQLPLVVLPHGGPWAHDEPGFDWWAQFLASRGYAVLQPQFRGSTGFGTAFEEAGFRQWGGLMQDDVTDSVKGAIAAGVADPHRVCIVGASYGGYAALAGAAFTPDLYACAVSVAGVTDLPEMIGYWAAEAGSKESDLVRSVTKHVGTAFDPNVIAKSPARAADRIKIPVLLIHGTDDTVVPLAQSKAMEAALARSGHPATLVTLPGEDHWLSRSETRIAVLKEIEAFLAKHL